jgi:hypothetical protein
MAVTININDLSLVHRDSGGITTATMPDVCNTPGVGPVPYPNIARSVDLKNGTRTIAVDGGNPAAIYGSEFCKSTGDEPGTGGGVKSGVNMSRATWITYSFDVKFEGKGACRLTDKMFMNNGNTVCLSGIVNPPVGGPGFDKCQDILEKIKDALYRRKPPGDGKGLVQRWEELAENLGPMMPNGTRGAPFTPGSQEHIDHIDQYNGWRNRAKNSLDDWDKNNCWDKGLPEASKVIQEGYRYVKNTPQLGPGKPLSPPMPFKFSSLFDLNYWKEATGLAGAALALYLIVSEGSRLYPPRNLVPVP